MVKLLLRATALLALGTVFVGTASAAKLVLTDVPQYAKELYSGGVSTKEFDTLESRYAYLVWPYTVGASKKATLTVTVSGAEFADRIRAGDLKRAAMVETMVGEFEYQTGGDITNLAATLEDGGAEGDSMVEFEIDTDETAIAPRTVAVADDPDTPDTNEATPGTAIALRLELPALRDVSVHGASIVVEVDAITSGDATDNADAPWRDVMVPARGDPAQHVVAAAKTAIMVTATPGSGHIDLDDRTKLLGPTGKMNLSTVTVDIDEPVQQSDGAPFSVENRRHSDGAGDVMIEVVGDIRRDDMIGWEWNGEVGLQKEEELSVSAGRASRAFDLDALFINDDEEQRPGSVGSNLNYTPGGKDPLRNGSLAVSVTVDFDSDDVMDTAPKKSTGTLSYNAPTAKAYALAPMSGGDETNVRLRCGQSFPCTIYLACDAADGSGFFGKMSDTIDPWSIEVLDSGMIADAIGADDEDFMGRMSCEVIGATQVQVLTRSDGVLVNNSYVGIGQQ